MKSMLQRYVDEFSSQQERRTLEDDQQRSVNNPVVFLFLGDLVSDSLQTLIEINRKKWHNSQGIFYLHVYQQNTFAHPNVLNFQLSSKAYDKKSVRKELHEDFYGNETRLIQLNQVIRNLSTKLSENGRMFGSLQKLNICVVTRVDDPANVLIQETTLLLREVLRESFKSIEVDLYGLLKEKRLDNGYEYSSSIGVSFLKELDTYQSTDYSFEQKLQITEDQFKVAVTHSEGALFDLVYLLSDKNEKGLIADDIEVQNCEIISQVNLLKNCKLLSENNDDSYNNTHFQRAIANQAGVNAYATAGFSKVERPNKSIALHAAYHFYNELLDWMKRASEQSQEKVVDLFELTESSLRSRINAFLPSKSKLEDMMELLSANLSYSQVKKLSVKEAEDILFESGANEFFQSNFSVIVEEELQNINLQTEIDQILEGKIINHESYGLYCAYEWTVDDENHVNIIREIRRLKQETKRQLEEAEAMLIQCYQQTVDSSDFPRVYLPFSDKKNLRSFKSYLFQTIYGLQYDLLVAKTKQAVLEQYESVLEEKNHFLREKYEDTLMVSSVLKQAVTESLNEADEYLAKNLSEYYRGVILKITKMLKERRGNHFLSSEKFFGNILEILGQGADSLMERLLHVTSSFLLNEADFHRSFEDELLERSNVQGQYDHPKVLSKEDLFKEIYYRIVENSCCNIDVYNFRQRHRHEEKYYFGDLNSQLMRYTLDREREAIPYKVGSVYEKKSSGIEKLTIMGGFHIEDIKYYRNGEKYYNIYSENGYEFHPSQKQPTA